MQEKKKKMIAINLIWSELREFKYLISFLYRSNFKIGFAVCPIVSRLLSVSLLSLCGNAQCCFLVIILYYNFLFRLLFFRMFLIKTNKNYDNFTNSLSFGLLPVACCSFPFIWIRNIVSKAFENYDQCRENYPLGGFRIGSGGPAAHIRIRIQYTYE